MSFELKPFDLCLKRTDIFQKNFFFRIQNIEREKVTHIYSKHGEFRDLFSQLQEIETKRARDRDTESP